MSMRHIEKPPQVDRELARRATQRRGGTIGLVDYLRHNKKWWLAPVLLVLLLLGTVALLGSAAAAPFIYTIF